MLNADLTAYAGLFILGIIVVCTVLYYLNYKIDGSNSVGVVVLLSFWGLFLSLGIVHIADFPDATPATVLTISICTIIFPLIYSISKLRGWVTQQKEEGSESNIHLLHKIKKWSLTGVGIVAVIVLLVLGNNFRTTKAEMKTASELATFGFEQFLSQDFDAYMHDLREASGLSDLTAKVDMLYDFETDYDSDEKELVLTINIKQLISEEIDCYFTTDYNKENGICLAALMDAMRHKFAQSYAYESENMGSVSVKIRRPKYEFSVTTSAGRVYEYSYGYVDTRTVEIDGDWVYHKEENPYENIWSTGDVVAKVPYDGMNASQISQTELGPPDKIEKCRDYYALRPERRSVTYRWYDDNGKLKFYAHAIAGEITSVTDYR